MRERWCDECGYCKAIIYVEAATVVMKEEFCATCRIAFALESLVVLLEDHINEV